MGCHFLLQCMKVKSESEVAQSCLTLHNPMDCSPPGSSIHGIFQARVLEWGAIAFSALQSTSAEIKSSQSTALKISAQKFSQASHYQTNETPMQGSGDSGSSTTFPATPTTMLPTHTPSSNRPACCHLVTPAVSLTPCLSFFIFWLCWVFTAVVRVFSSYSKWASHCNDFSCSTAQVLGHKGSIAVAHGLSSLKAYGSFPD